VTAATISIYQSFLSDDRRKTFFHGHSFTANPLTCAVARASLRLIHSAGSLRRVAGLEKLFLARSTALRQIPNVGDVRVLGGVMAVELVSDGGYLDTIGRNWQPSFWSAAFYSGR